MSDEIKDESQMTDEEFLQSLVEDSEPVKEQEDSASVGSEEPVKATEDDSDTGTDTGADTEISDNTDTVEPDEIIDYEAAYKKISAPFKANGKLVSFKNPEEIISLMQKGIDYSKKTMEISQHKRILKMLQSANINEDNLSFLIDLNAKNPDAIKKFFKDTNIDPLDIDINSADLYQAGKHKVSDQELAFNSVLDELSGDTAGQETITTIHKDWDDKSKELLWNNPEVMTTIHQQRQNGVYTLITDELSRLKAIGQIPVDMPFLVAYKTVGDQLMQAKTSNNSNTLKTNSNTIIERRVAKPKGSVANSSQAMAASNSKVSGVTKVRTDYSRLSDEEFMKQFDVI